MLGGHALLVGGFVRDLAFGIESKDIDIEVHGPVDPDDLIEALSRRGRVDTVGVSFGVIKFGQDVDVSFPRRDSKTGEGHTGFEIVVDQTMSIEEALSRRDFTINSIALDPVTGEVFDPFGGMEDIKIRALRHTSTDSFADDPLRVLRGVQFASRFSCTIVKETADLCRSMVDRFGELSIERVWGEWEKIFDKGLSMTAATRALVDTGWAVHFPEWGASARVTDRVLRVTGMLPGDELRAAVILGAQFSDRAPKQLESFLATIGAPLAVARDARKLASQPQVATGDPAADARVMARWLSPLPLQAWIDCHRMWGAPIEVQDQFVRPPLLRGDDLIDLGWKPGPEFGKVLAQATFTQDVEGWTTKEQALAWLDRRHEA